MSAGQFVVRVSARSQSWTSAGMTQEKADILADQLEDQVQGMGGGYGFVSFTAREDRELSLRAREVVSIEVRPERLPEFRSAVLPGHLEGIQRVAGAPR